MNKHKVNKDNAVQAYEIWWSMANDFDKKLEPIEEQVELIREMIDEKMKEIERFLPKGYRYPRFVKLDANGLPVRKTRRKK